MIKLMVFDKTKNKLTGHEGEQAAAEYLEKSGYEILERNCRLFCGEIDILARDGRTIVVVEVKTVRGQGFGLAQDLVRYKKQQKLRLLGRVVEQKYPGSPIRIDVIGIEFPWTSGIQIEHIKNAVN